MIGFTHSLYYTRQRGAWRAWSRQVIAYVVRQRMKEQIREQVCAAISEARRQEGRGWAQMQVTA